MLQNLTKNRETGSDQIVLQSKEDNKEENNVLLIPHCLKNYLLMKQISAHNQIVWIYYNEYIIINSE